MRRSPPKSTIADIPRPPEAPNAYKSPAPPMVVEAWCVGVERQNRRQLDDFTRRIWRKFAERGEPGAPRVAVQPVKQRQR